MKYLKKFESNNSWCDLDNPIGIEVRNTIKEILAELVEDGIYDYQINFNLPKIPPHIFIFSSSGGNNFDIEEVQPFVDQINSSILANNNKMSVRAILFMIAGHEKHHIINIYTFYNG
jgi:hypothetical protein